ncbi:phage holin [Lacticaseibacillus paracasei subsp. paracasei]|uniref:phage holin n=1 Tax=Lacticaseibacillus paracasei TaxID=1597 RepID=UPI000CD0A32A|nr:phage holin [Lacticaseibacillus paracasei]NVO34404.1 phage holin [Lacticaseibacillus paracasei subsp. paracasei]
MKINWKVRVLSVKFWLALVPASLLVIQTVAAVFGYNWDFANLGKELTAVVNAVFALLTIVGVAVDPTTEGVSDSQQALTYSGIIITKAAKIKALEDQIKALQADKEADQAASSAAPVPSSAAPAESAPASAAPRQ